MPRLQHAMQGCVEHSKLLNIRCCICLSRVVLRKNTDTIAFLGEEEGKRNKYPPRQLYLRCLGNLCVKDNTNSIKYESKWMRADRFQIRTVDDTLIE